MLSDWIKLFSFSLAALQVQLVTGADPMFRLGTSRASAKGVFGEKLNAGKGYVPTYIHSYICVILHTFLHTVDGLNWIGSGFTFCKCPNPPIQYITGSAMVISGVWRSSSNARGTK